MKQLLEDTKNKFTDQWKKLQAAKTEKIENTKINLRRTQSYGISKLIEKQIETDRWLRSTAEKMTGEKTIIIQQKMMELSDYWMNVSIKDYNDLNAKKAAKAVRELGLKDLLHIQYHEQKNKNRKTVLQSIDYKLNRYQQGLVA